VTTEQIVIAAVVVVLAIFGVVAAVRIVGHRPTDPDSFGAGGSPRVPIGTHGVARSDIGRSGVAYIAGEEWSVRAAGDVTIADDTPVRVTGQDGLTIVVEAVPAQRPAGE
jgi:membrane-bound ClpP family serine protease